MRYSFLFSLCVENIPEDRFNCIASSIVGFFLELEIELKKIILNKHAGFINIQDCDVLYFGDFIIFAENAFKKIIWEDGYLPFEFGSIITEGIPTQIFDEEDFKNFKINDAAS